jgi:hypothetical protein
MGAVQTTLPSEIQVFIFIDDNCRLRESFHKIGSFSVTPS